MKKDKVMFIVDFGLAKEYIDPDTNKHIPYRCRISTKKYYTYIDSIENEPFQGAQVTDGNCPVHVDQYSPG